MKTPLNDPNLGLRRKEQKLRFTSLHLQSTPPSLFILEGGGSGLSQFKAEEKETIFDMT